MRSTLLSLSMLSGALAARPFMNEPDTGIEDVFPDITAGTQIPLDQIVGLPDFDWSARHYLNISDYTYYRNGAAGEWSYRNNLEVFHRYRLRPRMMRDITNIESSLPTTILGHNVSAPFFITPCSRGAYGNPTDKEKGLMQGAAQGNILYMNAGYSDLPIEEIGELKAPGQVFFKQIYLTANDTQTQNDFDAAAAAGASAIVYTVDSAADGNRHRAARFGVGSADSSYSYITWDEYDRLKTMTDLPIIIKGIQTWEDAVEAVERGVDAIYLSNHGGRQLDGSPSSFEVAIEIHQNAPEVFKKLDVLADGGIRYGADAIKMLSLGVKAVGIGRPFMYANVYGTEGVKHGIDIMKHEIAIDAANAGIGDLHKIDPSFVKWTPDTWFS